MFPSSAGTSRALKIALDAELDGEQPRHFGSTPDSDGNDEKMASKVRVVF
jgi:hypothetical protein